jgi:hypothetical protein
MKPFLAMTMIVMGGLLILGPVWSAHKQKERIADFYQKQGNGAPLPEVMRPHDAYDWICLVGGALLAFAGVMQAVRLPNKGST